MKLTYFLLALIFTNQHIKHGCYRETDAIVILPQRRQCEVNSL